VLEAAVEWQRHRILFVTDNIPFEDYLRIYLLDTNGRSSTRLCWARYTPRAHFPDLIRPPNVLRFGFIGGITWPLPESGRPDAIEQ